MASEFYCGCTGVGLRVPTIRTSKYFEDVSASIAIVKSESELRGRFSWLLESRQALPTGAFVEAEFTNPSDTYAAPLRVVAREVRDNTKVSDSPKRFYFLSEVVNTFRCTNYSAVVRVYADSSRTKVLGEHTNAILSRVDTSQCSTADFLHKMEAMEKAALKDSHKKKGTNSREENSAWESYADTRERKDH